MKNLFIFLVVSVISSCSISSKKTHNILSFQEMQNVTWDCMQTDEFLINYVFKDTLLHKDSVTALKYEQVFKLHNTNKKQFFESLKYYQSKPDIYKKLLDSISAFGFRIKKENELQNKKRVQPIKDVD